MRTEFDKLTVLAWDAALRSGNYEQGQGALRDDDDNYCCLGVLCDVVGSGHWASDGKAEIGGYIIYVVNGYRADALLPPEFDTVDPMLIDEDGQWAGATTMNDGLGYTFEQIADAIRRTYPEYFQEG